ncbi:MAG TPA: CpaF family protein, partial [Actinomycetota bacterium]|nr:CpaF family protein [Actinomycetota bacterium]
MTAPPAPAAASPDLPALTGAIRRRLVEGMDLAALEEMPGPERRLHVRERVLAILRDERALLPAGELNALVNRISDDVVGLGPVERLLKDPEVSEV